MTAEERPTQEQLLEVNGIDLFYQEYGEGEPLLLLHGFFGTHAFWEPYIQAFAKHYRLIIPDLRGHGYSTNPSGAYSERQSARDMFALLEHLGIDHIRGIGFSSGGMILLHMAIQQPARIEAMVLMDATYTHTAERRAIQAALTMETADPAFLAQLREWHPRGDDQVRALLDQFGRFSDDDMNYTPSALTAITARTLIVHGDHDEFFPVSIAVEMYRAIPHSYLWVVPNASHVLFFKVFGGTGLGEELFPSVALDFLQGKWESSR